MNSRRLVAAVVAVFAVSGVVAVAHDGHPALVVYEGDTPNGDVVVPFGVNCYEYERWGEFYVPEGQTLADCTPTPPPTTTIPPTTTTTPTTTTVPPTTSTTTAPPTTAPPTTDPNGLFPAYQPIPGCPGATDIPLGQGSGAVNFEPLGPVWCYNLIDPPTGTAEVGANSWVDDFTVGCPQGPNGCTSMMTLADGEMGYRAFDTTGQAPPTRGQHWINQNHWMTDVQGGFTGGSSLRPDRAFNFENGKFIIEGDFSASMAEYGGDTWGELTITSAPNPTYSVDGLYAYGQFGGYWSVGCRLESSRTPVCAVQAPTEADAPNSGCNAVFNRVLEVSYFQHCGNTSFGGGPFPHGGEADRRWRECVPDGPDLACRDRFRMEVTKSSITLYVNGHLYFQSTGWPSSHQLPDSFVNGDVYAYQSNWQNRAGDRAFRYHWDHFAVNPSHGPEAGEFYP